MEIKNNSKKVEKKYSYSVVDIVLTVDQCCEERGIYSRLISEYRLAYTDDESLSKFVSLLKKDPLKHYKRHFDFKAPIISKVVINPISLNNYTIGTISTRKGYFILSEYTTFTIHDLLKHNRHFIQYHPKIK